MKRRRVGFSLKQKIALMIMAAVLGVSFFIFLISYILYTKKTNSFYEEQLIGVSTMISSYLDQEEIEEWFEGKREITKLGNPDDPDDYYEYDPYRLTHDFLRDVGHYFDIANLSVIRPEGDALRYAMDVWINGYDPNVYSVKESEAQEAELSTHELSPGELETPMKKSRHMKESGVLIGDVRGETVFSRGDSWIQIDYPLLDKGNNKLYGYLEITISYSDELRYISTAGLQMFLLILILAVLFAILPVIFTSRKIVRPIYYLSENATKLIEAKKDSETTETNIFGETKFSSSDEVGVLYRSLTQMEQDMNTYVRDLMKVTADNERVRTELDLATQIQNSQLPHTFPPFPDRNEFSIYASMKPAKSVGGDFYDFYMADDDHLVLVMADVSGKGIPAALYMMISRILIKTHAQKGLSPAEILVNLNDQLSENDSVDMFVTVWLAILNLSTGEGVSVNAGHEDPVIRHAGGDYELVKYRHFPPAGTFAGIRYQERSFRLSPGDSLFVYTDGVPEARRGGDREFYGTDRLLETLNRDREAAPEELIGSVMSELQEFTGDGEQFDDITMMNLQYRGTPDHTPEGT